MHGNYVNEPATWLPADLLLEPRSCCALIAQINLVSSQRLARRQNVE